jgi:hypothetical protein
VQPIKAVGFLLSILGWTLLALLLVIVAVLVIPTELEACGVVSPDRLHGSADVWWAWGALRVHAAPSDGVEFRLFGRRLWRYRRGATAATPQEEDADEPKEAKERRRPSIRMVVRIVRRVFRSFRLRLRVVGRLGTGDPYETAKLFGTLQAAHRLLPGLDARGVHIDWLEPVVNLDGQLRGRVWPIGIAWIAASEWWRWR